MIEEVRVRGFKTLRDVTLRLGPGITVLVGANNSGKSNILSALKLLRAIADKGDFHDAAQTVAGRVDLAGLIDRGAPELGIDVAVDRSRYEIALQINNAGLSMSREQIDVDGLAWVRTPRGLVGPPPLHGVNTGFGWLPRLCGERDDIPGGPGFLSALRSIRFVDLVVPALRAESLPVAGVMLGPDGSNLAAVLDVLRNTAPNVFKRIEEEVRHPITDIKQILTPPGATPGAKVVGVEEVGGGVFRSSELSDGLLLFIALSTASQVAGVRPSLLAIEEPERGIHPRRIADVIDQLWRVAETGTQVLLTTHSPLVLDEFKDHPESILLVERTAQGTQLHRLTDHPDWSEQLTRGISLGDVWYSGILGGVP